VERLAAHVAVSSVSVQRRTCAVSALTRRQPIKSRLGFSNRLAERMTNRLAMSGRLASARVVVALTAVLFCTITGNWDDFARKSFQALRRSRVSLWTVREELEYRSLDVNLKAPWNKIDKSKVLGRNGVALKCRC